MDLSYQDLQYIRTALEVYINHLKKYDEDDDDITEDEYSEMQDDIMMMSNLLGEISDEIDELEKAKDRSPPDDKLDLHVVSDKNDLD